MSKFQLFILFFIFFIFYLNGRCRNIETCSRNYQIYLHHNFIRCMSNNCGGGGSFNSFTASYCGARMLQFDVELPESVATESWRSGTARRDAAVTTWRNLIASFHSSGTAGGVTQTGWTPITSKRHAIRSLPLLPPRCAIN